jgi:cytosine/adenosine deaminase-related metal-dependent hydrolase
MTVEGDRAVVLAGRVATMDSQQTVLDDGVVYVRDTSIVDVRRSSDPVPEGFDAVPVVATGGTIFPGLVELHNHLPYDVLGLWNVPRRYGNRDEWSGPSTPEYRRLITGPMQVLGADPDVVAAVVRFVETRCLLGGTTTSQGVTLASDPEIVTHFRGLVRNVEARDVPGLPAAATHISDVAAMDANRFLATISGKQKVILHLAEGTDRAAHDHFAALEIEPGKWAITPNLIAIHCAALTEDDFGVLSDHGGTMVWSPFSNLLLYGQTADIGAALRRNVTIAIGSDWAPSGSKNLLGELKVARIVAADAGVALSDADLVAMATSIPARMVGWDSRLGSIEKGKLADLVVVAGTSTDAYSVLVDATEAAIQLVMIDGVARSGTPALMDALGPVSGVETITVAGEPRVLNLVQASADPSVATVTVAEAQRRLVEALDDLPNHSVPVVPTALPAGQVRLAVAGLVDNNMSPRPHLPLNGRPTGPNMGGLGSGAPTPTVVPSPVSLPALTLDPIAAVDNPAFYDLIAQQVNLPGPIRDGLLAQRPR